MFEFKIAGSVKELQQKANEAFMQIADRMYDTEPHDDGYESVAWYGIAF